MGWRPSRVVATAHADDSAKINLGPRRHPVGSKRTDIVDWYHASEHGWKAARAVHGDDTSETRIWAKVRLGHLWQNRPKPLLEWFAASQLRDATTTGAQARARHLSTNTSRKQYPAFRQRRLPMGSGAVETSAKHLVRQRVKRAGSRQE
jgi:hypothetical protein